MQLFGRDSVEDLYCRGFGRDEILHKISVDIGYKACNVRRRVKHIDRIEYRFEFVQQTVLKSDFLKLLEDYVAGTIGVVDIFLACGLPAKARIRFDDLCVRMGCVDDLAELRATFVKPDFHLFDKDSAEDLYCRGFCQREIIDMVGVDVGVNGCHIRGALRYVDRDEYKCRFVCANFSRDDFLGFFSEMRAGRMSTEDIFVACGLPRKARIPLDAICERFGIVDELISARDAARSFTVDKMQATMVARYGAKTTLESPALVERVRSTVLERYGVEYVTQADEVQAKIRETSLARYGYTSPMASPAVIAKREATCLKRYGFKTSLLNPEVIAKQRATMIERYGCEFTFSNSVLRAKAVATLQERYGVTIPLCSQVLRERAMATAESHFGVPFAMQSPEVVAKVKATMRARYGYENYSQTDEYRKSFVATCQAKWGVNNPLQSPEIRAKACATMRERYGFDYASQSAEIKAKVRATKLKNGTYTASAAEEVLYNQLVEQFGANDVKRQYESGVYPYPCDFYVISRDLYIELNGYATHGGHWFGDGLFDSDVLQDLAESSWALFDGLKRAWTERDVEKRETARRNNLNYVVFWGPNGEDCDLWFHLGCPDGHDWDVMYSWLPDRDLNDGFDYPDVLDVSGRSISIATRAAGFDIFYQNELAYWDLLFDNKWGTVQARLYANRLKYLGKGPLELSNKEILRGLSISGMVRGYSIYDNSGMVEFLDEFNPKFVYDPCAGWGERMLTCALKNIKYLGIDINAELIKAHADLIQHYDLKDAVTVHGDAGRLDMAQGMHDAVFTCPPYWNAEIYTDFGAENLSYPDFLDWWERVILNCTGVNTKYFAYQINQKCKADMNEILLKHGWRFIKSIPVNKNRISHMARRRGIKQKVNFEEIQIFER